LANGSSVKGAGPQLSDAESGLALKAGSILVNLNTHAVRAEGGVTVEAASRGIELSAATVSGDLEKRLLNARGGVSIASTEHDVLLCADAVQADITAQRYSASGGPPTIRQGESLLSGEKITLSILDSPGQARPTVRVEIEGEQAARIDLDELAHHMPLPEE
jgi:hypothetical protein